MVKEYILCAAIWFDDKEKHHHQPLNIETGFVVCGMRHHNCFSTISSICKVSDAKLAAKERFDKGIEEVQGFLTNANRFVDRVDAACIAYEAGQTKEKLIKLYSEDLY